MVFVYILLVLILFTLLGLIYILLRRRQSNDLSDDFFARFNEKFPEILNQANSSLVTLASQRLGADKEAIKGEMEAKKTAIEELVKRVLEELDKNQKRLEDSDKQRIGNFESLRQSLEDYKKITQELSVSAEGLRKVLSNNQMRGAFGEKIAEDLLIQSGFVIGTDYTKQETAGDGRPDFTLYLPDKTKINIDSKFPYSNIIKMSETEDGAQKTQYLKLFEQDIKKKINDVCTRDYIDPGQNTVDFVVLFIPNEMIFSFIYEKFPSVWEDAMRRKVVLAGPFSFTAILRMVRQAYDNFRYQKNVQSIIAHIQTFEKEFVKYNEEFTKIGDRIDSLSRQYQEVSSTRTNKLLRVIDKIRLDDSQTPPPQITS